MIYIYTFGNKVLKVANSTPLEVGADNRSSFLYELRDNTGDNISNQNEYFGELTGMYWVWKNCGKQYKADDIIGFCHYNKGFLISERKLTSVMRGGYRMGYFATIKKSRSSSSR